MIQDDALYEWGLSVLSDPKYPPDVVQLVSHLPHSDADKKRIVEELKQRFINTEHTTAYALFDGRGRWSKAELSRSKLAKVLMHPYWTRGSWCPEPPTLSRFAQLPEATSLQIPNFDPLAMMGRLIIVGTGDRRWRLMDGCHRAFSLWTAGTPHKISVIRGIHPGVDQWRTHWQGSR